MQKYSLVGDAAEFLVARFYAARRRNRRGRDRGLTLRDQLLFPEESLDLPETEPDAQRGPSLRVGLGFIDRARAT